MQRKKAHGGLIVYHGSRWRGIIDLDANQPPEGGIGYGIYVTDDIEVARFYGEIIYELRLNLKDDDILLIGSEFDNYDSVVGQEGHSVLVGEHVEPFSFWIRDQRYTVGFEDSTEGAARTVSVINQLGERQSVFPDPVENALRYYIASKNKFGDPVDLEDFCQYEMEDLVDWDEMNREFPAYDFVNNNADVELVKERVWKILEPIHNAAEDFVKKSLGLVIDLMDIGQEAKSLGYRAVKMTGVRGGFPDTEILVFDSDDLEMVGEVVE